MTLRSTLPSLSLSKPNPVKPASLHQRSTPVVLGGSARLTFVEWGTETWIGQEIGQILVDLARFTANSSN